MRASGLAGLVLMLTVGSGCGTSSPLVHTDYRQEMREFVLGLSAFAKKVRPGFAVIPQNGHDLVLSGTTPTRRPAADYLDAVDGIAQESLFYGYPGVDLATPSAVTEYTLSLLQVARARGLPVLVIDYCAAPAKVDDAYRRNAELGFVGFAADHRALDDVPAYPLQPFSANDSDVHNVAGARNFLYLINPGPFATRTSFLDAVRATRHDLIVVDLFYGRTRLTRAEVASLKVKPSGAKRVVLAYMSIGEAEDYRYYWRLEWAAAPPSWLAEQNPDWPGNYKVRYWEQGWKNLIYGSGEAYLQHILDAGFDGVYLDIIDAFQYFEAKADR